MYWQKHNHPPPFPTQKEATMIEIILYIFELCDVTQYFAQFRSACPAFFGIYIFDFQLNVMGEGTQSLSPI